MCPNKHANTHLDCVEVSIAEALFGRTLQRCIGREVLSHVDVDTFDEANSGLAGDEDWKKERLQVD